MSYVGLAPTLQLYKKADFLGDGSTVEFNLVDPVTNEGGLLVIMGGVPQEPITAYTITSAPTYTNGITFASAPANGVDIWVIWLGSPDPDDIDLSTFMRTNESATVTKGFFDTNVTLTDAASIAWDLSLGNLATVTVTADRTLANPTNWGHGSFTLILKMDGSGGHTTSYGAGYKWPDGVVPTLDTSASAVNIISFISDGTSMYGTAVTGLA